MIMPIARARRPYIFFFFFNDTATTEIYTLSLHDALPICIIRASSHCTIAQGFSGTAIFTVNWPTPRIKMRSEEHTSELQSQSNLVCRLLLEKKKIYRNTRNHHDRPVPRSPSVTLPATQLT